VPFAGQKLARQHPLEKRPNDRQSDSATVTEVPALIRLARVTMANIRQNVALGLKAVFLLTTICGITSLWLAVMADTGAAVLVTLNGLRLPG
jgi:Cd2+/Zn2+-exporting ATPase